MKKVNPSQFAKVNCIGNRNSSNLPDNSMPAQSETPDPMRVARLCITLTIAEVDKVVNRTLNGNEDIVAAYLYGSTLRNDLNESSDIDLLIVTIDTIQLNKIVTIAQRLSEVIPGVDITVLRESEVANGIHPGWSRHYYTNVHRGGKLLIGRDVVGTVAATPTTFADALRRIVQLCQRTRLVLINGTKLDEAEFWLTKYQHWVPLCLMELLDIAGWPYLELHTVHDAFSSRFPTAPYIRYPYCDLLELQYFLEEMIKWLREHAILFGGEV